MRKSPVALLLAFGLILAIAPSTVNIVVGAGSGSFSVTLSDPIEDGYIGKNGTYERHNTEDYFVATTSISGIARGYCEWDISSIPDEAIITNTIFKYHGLANSRDAHIHEMRGARPSTSGDQAIYDEAGEGTVYADPAGFAVIGSNKQVDLGSSADTDLQNQLSSNWFAIGIQLDDETYPGSAVGSYIYSSEYATVGPSPTLYVEYTFTKSWQEAETWGDTLQIPSWQTVGTWGDLFHVILTVGPPVLISPDNDSTIYDNTPSFHWIVGTNATNHRFLLDNEDTFSTPIENVWLGISTMYTITTPLADDNYWWKVIAAGGGLENSSSVWTFELETPVGKQWQTAEIWMDFMSTLFPYPGGGTVDDPYIIENVEGLQRMKDNKSAHYALGCDIDASDTITWNDGAGFAPIPTYFNGSFDGRGYKIINLYINRSESDDQALFGRIGGPGGGDTFIKNVGLENVYVKGYRYVAALVGNGCGHDYIENCYSTGVVIGGYYCAGGLVAYNDGNIFNSYSTVSVSGNNSVGGLVGSSGDGSGAMIRNSYATGSVSGGMYSIGGLVGFLGQYGKVENCFSTGSVNGGGLIGEAKGGSTVSNSFWDNQTSGRTTSAGGTGKTTENMKDNRTFTDVAWSDGLTFPWDFADNPYDDVAPADIWDIDGVTNDGYPFLGIPAPGWKDAETWDDTLNVEEKEEPPPPPSDEVIWVVFVIRFLSIFGPFGFVAWKFTQIRDPATGARAAVWVGVGFVALVLLWFVVDAVEAVLYAL